jgi:hypothetical protein
VPPPVVKVDNVVTKIVAATDNFYIHNMSNKNDTPSTDTEMNTKNYLGDILSGGYAAFDLDVTYGGEYNLEPRVAI